MIASARTEALPQLDIPEEERCASSTTSWTGTIGKCSISQSPCLEERHTRPR